MYILVFVSKNSIFMLIIRLDRCTLYMTISVKFGELFAGRMASGVMGYLNIIARVCMVSDRGCVTFYFLFSKWSGNEASKVTKLS